MTVHGTRSWYIEMMFGTSTRDDGHGTRLWYIEMKFGMGTLDDGARYSVMVHRDDV